MRARKHQEDKILIKIFNVMSLQLKAALGFEPRITDLQSVAHKTQVIEKTDTYEHEGKNLADCLALLVQQCPDLTQIIEAWPSLPEAVKAGILAMVKAAR